VIETDDPSGQHLGVPKDLRQRRYHVPRLYPSAGHLRQERLIGHVPSRVHYGHASFSVEKQSLYLRCGIHHDIDLYDPNLHDELLMCHSPCASGLHGEAQVGAVGIWSEASRAFIHP
jgi:hypothetical protein